MERRGARSEMYHLAAVKAERISLHEPDLAEVAMCAATYSPPAHRCPRASRV